MNDSGDFLRMHQAYFSDIGEMIFFNQCQDIIRIIEFVGIQGSCNFSLT